MGSLASQANEPKNNEYSGQHGSCGAIYTAYKILKVLLFVYPKAFVSLNYLKAST